MLSNKVKSLLHAERRPKDRREFDQELETARRKGQHIPRVNFDKLVVTQEQAVRALGALGIDPASDFYAATKDCRWFPSGQGNPLFDLDPIVDPVTLTYWDDEYPGLSKDYLRITSLEGDGSYFYQKSTGAVIDAGWGDMADLAAGALIPRWSSFSEFLDWYYGEA